jgi:Mrp family chromosome partitioning ATPase
MGRTTMDVAARALNILETVHLKPRGVILNNIKPEDRRAYGYGYGYGYGYRYGYRYYKYYKYYNYYNYYYGEDGQEPKGWLQSFIDKISGRKS